MMKVNFIAGLFFVVFLLTGCAEEEERLLPYVRVDFSIPLSATLRSGMAEKVREGHDGYNRNGVIIIPDGYDSAGFTAYDATCTHDVNSPSEMVSIDVDSDLTAICPRCKTVYYIRTGGFSADGKSRLQLYRAVRSNDRIYVSN